MFALNLDADGRVLSATFPEYAPEDAETVEALPEGNISDYLYIDEAFVYDPLPTAEEPEQPTQEERIAALEAAFAALEGGVNDA